MSESKGAFDVTVEGLPFDVGGITGVTVTYGINMIPACMLTLNVPYIMEKAPQFFRDPSQYKVSSKKQLDVKIKFKSVTGCFDFTGFFDGLSVVQTPGGMDYTAIIKNKFQLLTELYPKVVGIYPGSMMPTRFIPNLKIERDEQLYSALLIAGEKLDATLTPAEWYVEYLKKVVQSQENPKFSMPIDTSDILEILQEQSYKESLQKVKEVMEKVDVQFAKTPSYKCQVDLPYHASVVLNGGDDAWQLLMTIANEIGCVLIPSDEKMYMVPRSDFLKLEGKCPDVGQQSNEINQAFPADYTNFVLNDNSYRNIKYCFVTPLGSDASMISRNNAIANNNLGRYPRKGQDEDLQPDDGANGILITIAPAYLGRTIGGLYMVHTKKIADGQEESYPEAGDKKELDEIEDGQKAIEKKQQTFEEKYGKSHEATRELLDNYAKTRFLQEKYADRTGSFTLQFNPKWVPGSVGFLASRQPEVYFNFFVTSVTHTIAISNARSGTAMTHINFNSARYSGTIGKIQSVDSNKLFEYDEGKMKSFQESWVQDNKSTFKERK